MNDDANDVRPYVVGMGAGVSNEYQNPVHRNSLTKIRSIKVNVEESGLTWGNLGILKKYLRRYIKVDAEYKYTVSYLKTALAFRLFGGVGVPLLGRESAIILWKANALFS